MSDKTEKNDYLPVIAERIKSVMAAKHISQADLLSLARKHNYQFSQPTISKILSGSGSMSIQNVVRLANLLSIDLNDLFAEGNSTTVRTFSEKITESRLIRQATDPEMVPYLNSYYVYFISTESQNDKILEAQLQIYSSTDKQNTLAHLEFYTGKRDGFGNPIIKQYDGEFYLSPHMSAAYCVLISEEIGEVTFFSFNFIPISYERLRCRVALSLTTCSGSNRNPTAHRMIISDSKIAPDHLEVLRGQLLLNESEILISEDDLENFLQETDEEFRQYFCPADHSTLLKGLLPAKYYYFNESLIRHSFLNESSMLHAINLIRQYSTSKKTTKVGAKCNDLLYRYLNLINEEE